MKQAPSRILPYARALLVAGAVWAGLPAVAQVQPDPYAPIGELVRAGKLAEAAAKADEYLAGKPRDPQMRFLKSVVQSELGRPDEAIETLTQLTQEFPELPEPYNNLAVLYAGQNQYDKARQALEMAIRLNPNYATAHENLGDIYAKLASQSYGRSLQLQGNNPQATQKVAALTSMLAPQTAKPRSTGNSGK